MKIFALKAKRAAKSIRRSRPYKYGYAGHRVIDRQTGPGGGPRQPVEMLREVTKNRFPKGPIAAFLALK